MTDHGGSGRRYQDGCRCQLCTKANRDRNNRRRAEREAARTLVNGRLTAPLPPGRHGRASTYSNHGCRCEPCLKAFLQQPSQRTHQESTS
jgi:hypothetical protein